MGKLHLLVSSQAMTFVLLIKVHLGSEGMGLRRLHFLSVFTFGSGNSRSAGVASGSFTGLDLELGDSISESLAAPISFP